MDLGMSWAHSCIPRAMRDNQHTGHGASLEELKGVPRMGQRCFSLSRVTLSLFWQESISVEKSVKRKLLDTLELMKNFLSCHPAGRYKCFLDMCYFLGCISQASLLNTAKEAIPVFCHETRCSSPAQLLQAVALAVGWQLPEGDCKAFCKIVPYPWYKYILHSAEKTTIWL